MSRVAWAIASDIPKLPPGAFEVVDYKGRLRRPASEEEVDDCLSGPLPLRFFWRRRSRRCKELGTGTLPTTRCALFQTT